MMVPTNDGAPRLFTDLLVIYPELRSYPFQKACHGLNFVQRMPVAMIPDSEPNADLFQLTWGQSAAASRRERAAEGMIVGAAIAEALALARNGLPRRTALRIFGRSPLRFQFLPGLAAPGEYTHCLIITIQAMLESRADHKSFGRHLFSRLMWYRFSMPLRHIFRCIIQPSKSHGPAVVGLASNPLIRAVPIAVLVQGSQHAKPWIELSNKQTIRDDRAVESAMLIANAAQLTQLLGPKEFKPDEALRYLTSQVEDPSLKSLLEALQPLLESRVSVLSAAKKMGWGNGIPDSLYAIASIAIYAWLRHPMRYRFVAERCALLGGQCAAVAALAGSLSAATLGKRGIPPEWRTRLSLFPHDEHWINQAVARIKDWPHGVEDIQAAHAEPSMPIAQVLRNLFQWPFRVINYMFRLPAYLLGPKR